MKKSDILRIYYNDNSPHDKPAMVVMREEDNDLYLLHAIRGKDAVEIYKKLTKGAIV